MRFSGVGSEIQEHENGHCPTAALFLPIKWANVYRLVSYKLGSITSLFCDCPSLVFRCPLVEGGDITSYPNPPSLSSAPSLTLPGGTLGHGKDGGRGHPLSFLSPRSLQGTTGKGQRAQWPQLTPMCISPPFFPGRPASRSRARPPCVWALTTQHWGGLTIGRPCAA